MIVVLGTFRLVAGKLAQARPAMAAMVEASRGEDGCVGYSYSEDLLEPGLIRVVELWRDREALDRHFASDHLRAWRASWTALGIGDRTLQAYDADEGRIV